MPIEGWTDRHATAVRALAEGVASTLDPSNPRGMVARSTRGLPVYCDIGGCLVITADGEILEYEFEGGGISRVTDRASVRLARAAAAQAHGSLADLMPTDGVTCTACKGTGWLAKLRCGMCDGTGLVAGD